MNLVNCGMKGLVSFSSFAFLCYGAGTSNQAALKVGAIFALNKFFNETLKQGAVPQDTCKVIS